MIKAASRIFAAFLAFTLAVQPVLGAPLSFYGNTRLLPPSVAAYEQQALVAPVLNFFQESFDRLRSAWLARRGSDFQEPLSAIGQNSAATESVDVEVRELSTQERLALRAALDHLHSILAKGAGLGVQEEDLVILRRVVAQLDRAWDGDGSHLRAFKGIVRSREDYLLGFSRGTTIAFSEELLAALRDQSPAVLAEFLFHEGYASIKPERNKIEHQDRVQNLQRRLFGPNLLQPIVRGLIDSLAPVTGRLGQHKGTLTGNEQMLYDELLQTLSKDSRYLPYAETAAHAVSRFHSGSLTRMLQWGVISQAQHDVLRARGNLSQGEVEDLAQRTKQLIDEYLKHGYTEGQTKQFLNRYVPYRAINRIQQDSGLAPSYLADIARNHADFDELIYAQQPLVAELRDRVGGLRNAWIIVVGHGRDPEQTRAWVDDAEKLVDEISDIVGNTGLAWEIVIKHGPANTRGWVRDGKVVADTLLDIAGNYHNAWQIIVNQGIPDALAWAKSARPLVRSIAPEVGGENTAWEIAIGHGLKSTRAWIGQQRKIMPALLGLVGSPTLAWKIILRHEDPVSWANSAIPSVNQIAERVHSRSLAWEIVLGNGLPRINAWLEASYSVFTQARTLCGTPSTAWKIIVKQGLKKAAAWSRVAAVEAAEIEDLVGGSRNAWELLVKHGLAGSRTWITHRRPWMAALSEDCDGPSTAWLILIAHDFENLQEARAWTRHARTVADRLAPKVSGERNAWRIVVRQGPRGAEPWAARAEAHLHSQPSTEISLGARWRDLIDQGLPEDPLSEPAEPVLVLGREAGLHSEVCQSLADQLIHALSQLRAASLATAEPAQMATVLSPFLTPEAVVRPEDAEQQRLITALKNAAAAGHQTPAAASHAGIDKRRAERLWPFVSGERTFRPRTYADLRPETFRKMLITFLATESVQDYIAGWRADPSRQMPAPEPADYRPAAKEFVRQLLVEVQKSAMPGENLNHLMLEKVATFYANFYQRGMTEDHISLATINATTEVGESGRAHLASAELQPMRLVAQLLNRKEFAKFRNDRTWRATLLRCVIEDELAGQIPEAEPLPSPSPVISAVGALAELPALAERLAVALEARAASQPPSRDNPEELQEFILDLIKHAGRMRIPALLDHADTQAALPALLMGLAASAMAARATDQDRAAAARRLAAQLQYLAAVLGSPLGREAAIRWNPGTEGLDLQRLAARSLVTEHREAATYRYRWSSTAIDFRENEWPVNSAFLAALQGELLAAWDNASTPERERLARIVDRVNAELGAKAPALLHLPPPVSGKSALSLINAVVALIVVPLAIVLGTTWHHVHSQSQAIPGPVSWTAVALYTAWSLMFSFVKHEGGHGIEAGLKGHRPQLGIVGRFPWTIGLSVVHSKASAGIVASGIGLLLNILLLKLGVMNVPFFIGSMAADILFALSTYDLLHVDEFLWNEQAARDYLASVEDTMHEVDNFVIDIHYMLMNTVREAEAAMPQEFDRDGEPIHKSSTLRTAMSDADYMDVYQTYSDLSPTIPGIVDHLLGHLNDRNSAAIAQHMMEETARIHEATRAYLEVVTGILAKVEQEHPAVVKRLRFDADASRRLIDVAAESPASFDAAGRPELIDINYWLQFTADFLKGTKRSGVLDIRYEPAPGQPKVRMDPIRLFEVIYILVNNAFEAALKGSDQPGIRKIPLIISLDPRDHHLTIRVTDVGAGMRPEVFEHIFALGFTTKADGRGHGRGLNLLWRMVRSARGSVEAITKRADPAAGQSAAYRLYETAIGFQIEPVREDRFAEPSGTEFKIRLPLAGPGHGRWRSGLGALLSTPHLRGLRDLLRRPLMVLHKPHRPSQLRALARAA